MLKVSSDETARDRFPVEAFLRRLPYFAGLEEAQVGALASSAVRLKLSAGQAIFIEGEPSAGLWMIESGTIKIFKLTAEGREHILTLLGPGETFNDIAALDGLANPASASALSAAVAWTIPSATMLEALRNNPALALAVIGALTGRVRHLVLEIEDLALRSVTGRLARFVLEQSSNPRLAAPAITRAVMATHLGTTPESVSRALRVLEEIGAIRFDRHRIVIIRPDLLREIAMI